MEIEFTSHETLAINTGCKIPPMAKMFHQAGGITESGRMKLDSASEDLGHLPRMPWLGLGLVGISVAFSLSFIVFFAGWGAADRAHARTFAAASQQVPTPSEKGWREDGARWACPLH